MPVQQPTSIFRPILMVVMSLVSIGSLLISGLLYVKFVAPLEQRFLDQYLNDTSTKVNEAFKSKIEEGKAMAVSITAYSEISQALRDGDREPVVEKLKSIKQHFAGQSKYKNIGVQVIDGDDVSFVKSWNPDSFGEKVSHPLFNDMKQRKEVVGGIGVGAGGFGVLAFAPVKSGESLLGSLVVSGGVGAIAKELKSKGDDWVLLLDPNYIQQRYQTIPGSIKENIRVNDWLLANNKWFDSASIDKVAQHAELLNHDSEKQIRLIGNEVMMSFPLWDETGKPAGKHVVIRSANDLFQQVDLAKQAVYIVIALLLLVFMVSVAAILWMVRVKAVLPMKQLVKNLTLVCQDGKFTHQMPVTVMDEIGQVFLSVNHLLAQLQLAMQESKTVMKSIAEADFSQRMQGEFVGDLASLKEGVNASAESVAFMMAELEKVMLGLAQGRLDIRMDSRVPAAFRHQVESALGSISDVIGDVNAVMAKMTQGDFNGRVNAAAAGELQQLKAGINASMDIIAHAIESISGVVSAQAQGDLTQSLPSGTFKGQLHQLKNAINFSSSKVKETVIESIGSASVVEQVAADVLNEAQQLSGRIQEQAAALEQTSATMHEITSAVQANTENATRVASLAHQVQHQSTDGVQVMQQTIEAMRSIQQASSKIADIVSIIDSIAFQTNLLALNAAVEAARAGEHGRGFAVVASEVRALAGKSADAAKDIKGLIEDSVQRIDAGTQLADKSGEVLIGISDSIKEVAAMIEAISAASKEQSSGIQQVNMSISDIDRVTQENAQLVEQTTAAANALNQEAERLTTNMSFFKTGQSIAKETARVSTKAVTASHAASKGLPAPKATKSDEWSEF